MSENKSKPPHRRRWPGLSLGLVVAVLLLAVGGCSAVDPPSAMPGATGGADAGGNQGARSEGGSGGGSEGGVALEAGEYDRAFAQSVAVLRDVGFVVDRQDHRFGQITTLPRPSPTIFEPWQPDHTYLDQAARATLGSLRRSARVSLARATDPTDASTEAGPAAEPPPGYALEVEVLIERLQVPTRRLSGTTRGSVFDDLDEIPAELQRRGVVGRYWQPVGRDVHLEARLRDRILRRLHPAS